MPNKPLLQLTGYFGIMVREKIKLLFYLIGLTHVQGGQAVSGFCMIRSATKIFFAILKRLETAKGIKVMR